MESEKPGRSKQVKNRVHASCSELTSELVAKRAHRLGLDRRRRVHHRRQRRARQERLDLHGKENVKCVELFLEFVQICNLVRQFATAGESAGEFHAFLDGR